MSAQPKRVTGRSKQQRAKEGRNKQKPKGRKSSKRPKRTVVVVKPRAMAQPPQRRNKAARQVQAGSRTARAMVQSRTVSLKATIVKDAVEAAFFPQLPQRVILPPGVLPEGGSVAPSRQTVGFNIDIAPIASQISTLGFSSVPAISDSNGQEATTFVVWPASGGNNYTIVHTCDTLVPLIMPVVPLNAAATGQTWTYNIAGSSWTPGVNVSESIPGRDNVQALILNTGFCSSMPIGFQNRPACTVRDPYIEDRRRYIWVDSASNSSTALSMNMTITFGSCSVTTNFQVVISVYFREPSDAETTVNVLSIPFTPVASGSVNVASSLGVLRNSGYYRFEAGIASTTASAVYQVSGISGYFQTLEFVGVATGMVMNTSLVGAKALGSGLYPLGSAALVSLRGPHLTTEGTVLAIKTQPNAWHQFSDITIRGPQVVNDTTVGNSLYNGDAGDRLTKGLYSISHPGIRPKAFLPLPGATSQDPYGTATPDIAACLVGCDNPWGCWNVAFINYATGASSVPLRICYDLATAILLRTQLLSPTPVHEMTSAEFDEFRVAVRTLPVFTENPWHLSLLAAIPKIVGAIDTVDTVYRRASRWAGNVKEIVQKVPQVAEYFRSFDWS